MTRLMSPRVLPPTGTPTAGPVAAMRRCARCGREGRNAFRPVQADVASRMWVCTHDEPCAERTRLLRRAAVRAAHGRPPQSPIAGHAWDERRACVIGSDAAARDVIATALGDLGSLDVESLDLTQKSIERIGSRDFCLIVVDVRAGDPVALLGQLERRLEGAARRNVSVVVVHDLPDAELPAIHSLLSRRGAQRIARPIGAAALMTVIDQAASPGSADRLADVAS